MSDGQLSTSGFVYSPATPPDTPSPRPGSPAHRRVYAGGIIRYYRLSLSVGSGGGGSGGGGERQRDCESLLKENKTIGSV